MDTHFCKLSELLRTSSILQKGNIVNKLRILNYASFLSGFISSWLLLILCYVGTVTEANCPLTAHTSWIANDNIPYAALTFTTPELNSVAIAIGRWQYHNQHVNCSGVWFPPQNSEWLALEVSGANNQDPESSSAAATTSRILASGTLASATIVLHWAATYGASNTPVRTHQTYPLE
jgi:hypothetical protein